MKHITATAAKLNDCGAIADALCSSCLQPTLAKRLLSGISMSRVFVAAGMSDQIASGLSLWPLFADCQFDSKRADKPAEQRTHGLSILSFDSSVISGRSSFAGYLSRLGEPNLFIRSEERRLTPALPI